LIKANGFFPPAPGKKGFHYLYIHVQFSPIRARRVLQSDLARLKPVECQLAEHRSIKRYWQFEI